MKRIVIHLISCLVLVTNLASLSWAQDEYYLYGGVAFPSGPERFSDYWGSGLTVGGGLGFVLSESATIVTLFDYGRFGLDDERVVQTIGLQPPDNSISGAATNIISGSALIRYVPSGSRRVIPAFFDAGLSVAYSSIGGATGTYSGYTTSQDGELHVGLSLVLGGGLSLSITESLALDLQGRYAIGLITNDRANTQFSPISIGIRGKM